jgi:hypothetical protein
MIKAVDKVDAAKMSADDILNPKENGRLNSGINPGVIS